MFVKIKLEDHGPVKAPLIFDIDDGATIYDLKTHLECYVDIPVDEQQIQTLNRTIENFDTLSKVVDQEVCGNKMNGTAISLYANKKFHCFLQFYNQKEGDNQAYFFSKPSDAPKLPIDTVPQYCEKIVDSDESWHSTASETDSTDNSSNSSASDSSEDTRNLKRKLNDKNISPEKRSRLVTERNESNFEPKSTTATSLLILDNQIPIVSHTQTSSQSEVKVIATTLVNSPPPTLLTEIDNNNLTPFVSVQPVAPIIREEAQVEPKESALFREIVNHNLTIPISANQEAAPTAPTAPYIIMKPEHRKYALVISNNVDGQHPAFNRQMEHLFQLFESSQGCDRLNFSDYASITAYDDKMWVLCEDNETCDWITAGIRTTNFYKCSSLIKHFGLLKCTMVLPKVVEGKQLENNFKLLELQNPGLCTKKWCVFKRSMLKTADSAKAVTTLCTNELLTLYVDKESKCYIEQNGSKLKYCFWKLNVEF